MRKDILERMKILKQDDIKPNYSELAKQLGCDYRTVKKYYENNVDSSSTKKVRPSILDLFKEIIKEKLQVSCKASDIFRYIKKKGYEGSYSVVKRYCKKYKIKQSNEATIRFETTPGLQAQVDWKESKKLTNRNGEIFIINIFLVVLGYSRMKYIELTIDRNQATNERPIERFKNEKEYLNHYLAMTS